jgi:cytoplasmic iron level regulating protein YaaA (DUF328/UPF0246 family)
MKPTLPKGMDLTKPELSSEATQIAEYLKTLSLEDIKEIMKISESLAVEVKKTIDNWDESNKGAAMFSFRGDVYSGLQVGSFDGHDIRYANEHLRILSGLYGILKSLDAVSPYRLEMGYKLPSKEYEDLYRFWSEKILKCIKTNQKVINLTSAEYGKVIIPKLEKSLVISPVFYTYNPKTKKNSNIAVHSKIARGAFAHWLIKNKADDNTDLSKFNEIGYRYDAKLSKPNSPVFICKEFGGKGLSTRLK